MWLTRHEKCNLLAKWVLTVVISGELSGLQEMVWSSRKSLAGKFCHLGENSLYRMDRRSPRATQDCVPGIFEVCFERVRLPVAE